MKKLVLLGLTSTLMLRWLRRLWGDSPTILMMHRFADPDLGVSGHNLAVLAANLEFIRSQGYEPIRIDELVHRVDRGESVRKCVAFTVDDGYADFSAAAKVFSSFDCPVTVNIASSFIDGADWYWWDKVEYLFEETEKASCKFASGAVIFHYDLSTPALKKTAVDDFVAWGKTVPDDALRTAVADLTFAVDVHLPTRAPAKFAALTWSECRRLETKGISFGPHTVAHPVLSQVTAEQSAAEMRGSWERLLRELQSPVPVFCYPYGTSDAFSERERVFAREMGLLAAVSSQPGIISVKDIRDERSRFAIPRYAYPDREHAFRQIVSGMEKVKSRLRREA